jgi:putative SOS response-associated peptidase YedK
MCGRFTLTTNDYESVAQALDADLHPDVVASYRARYNVAPTDPHWIVCVEGRRRVLRPGIWGFPGSGKGGVRINARAETAHARPTFREAFWSARCGVAADGFFEWTGPKIRRQPLWFHRPDHRPFIFAGLYRDDVDPISGDVARRFTILTTAPNDLVAPYHDRMPVILDTNDAHLWLDLPTAGDRGRDTVLALGTILRAVPNDWLVVDEVDRRVGDVRNDDASLLEPPEPTPSEPEQQTLF